MNCDYVFKTEELKEIGWGKKKKKKSFYIMTKKLHHWKKILTFIVHTAAVHGCVKMLISNTCNG